MSVLPCPKLQHLSLRSCDLDFTAGGSAFLTSIRSATALTSLHVYKCRVLVDDQAGAERATAAQFLSSLAPLASLQQLSVCAVGVYTSRAASNHRCASAHVSLSATLLQRLQHLTQLHLQADLSEADGLVQHIGSMTDLQDLRLGGVTKYCPRPQRLHVTQLTALTKLRRLGLHSVSLACDSAAQSGANAAALLAWLPMLQELSSLQLRAVRGLEADSSGDTDLYPPTTAFRALTAGTALQHIDLRGTRPSQNAWQRAFPLVRKSTSITSLRCGTWSTNPFYISFACGSCPNLQELQMDAANDSTWQNLQRQQNTGLTRLSVKLLNWQYAQGIQQLTQLKSLQLQGPNPSRIIPESLSHGDLRPLTQLTQLSFLCIKDSFVQEQDKALWDMFAVGAPRFGASAGSVRTLKSKVRLIFLNLWAGFTTVQTYNLENHNTSQSVLPVPPNVIRPALSCPALLLSLLLPAGSPRQPS
jgi:hypothetical protein